MYNRLYDWSLVAGTWAFGMVGLIAEAADDPTTSAAGIMGGIVTLAALWLKLRYNTEAMQAKIAAKDERIDGLSRELEQYRNRILSNPPARTGDTTTPP